MLFITVNVLPSPSLTIKSTGLVTPDLLQFAVTRITRTFLYFESPGSIVSNDSVGTLIPETIESRNHKIME